jgi:predicted ArsR family transcriptional regulator
MQRTRDEVVRILNERGEASVAELAEAIGVSKGSIRRHMDLMVADGLLATRLVRQGRGRPLTRYSLSEAGEEQSSSEHYSRLLDRISPALASLPTEAVDGRDGEAILQQLFDQIAASVAREHAPLVTAEQLDGRVEQVTDVLRGEGILEDVRDEGEFFVLRNSGCPYRSTAEETHACCAADRRTIELLLGAPVEQIKTVAAGGELCEYVVRKDHQPSLVALNLDGAVDSNDEPMEPTTSPATGDGNTEAR